MKTKYTDSEETTLVNEIKGVRTTSDNSVATRGNVKNTLKDFNKHIEDQYYDREEIDYFFSKIWHWVKKHIIHTDFFINLLGDVEGAHKSREDYERISKKPISVESVDNLVALLNAKINEVQGFLSTPDNTLPNGFIYVQFPKTKAPSKLWPGTAWDDISYLYEGSYLRVDTKGIDYGNGPSPKFQSGSLDDIVYGSELNSSRPVEIQREDVPSSDLASNISNFQQVPVSHPFTHITPQCISVRIWQKAEWVLTVFDIYEASHSVVPENVYEAIQTENLQEVLDNVINAPSESDPAKESLKQEIKDLMTLL